MPNKKIGFTKNKAIQSGLHGKQLLKQAADSGVGTCEITLEELALAFQPRKNQITPEIVQLVNETAKLAEFDGFDLMSTLSYFESVLYKHKGTFEDYLNAVRYCAFLESCNYVFTDAYAMTFPRNEVVRKAVGADKKSYEYKMLRNAAARYRKSPLVISILTISDVQLYLQSQELRFQAINVLATEMTSAPYSKDRINAADKLLVHTAPPATLKIDLEVGAKQNDALASLNEQLSALATSTLENLREGKMDLNMLGAMKPKDDEDIVDVEVENG